MPRTSFQVISDDIDPFLVEVIDRGAQMVTDKMERGARQIEAYAKQNAPWTDITGAARDGLYADVYEDQDEIVLELGHSVAHGQWLETIQDGRFAIILPTLESLGNLVFKDAAQAIMGGGDYY